MEYRKSKRIKLCSVILILLGVIGSVYGLFGIVIPTAMPDSIGAYFIRDLFEQPTLIFGPPGFVLIIGLEYIVFGAIAIYIDSRVHSTEAIKRLGIIFMIVSILICLLNMFFVFANPLNIGAIIVFIIAIIIGTVFISVGNKSNNNRP